MVIFLEKKISLIGDCELSSVPPRSFSSSISINKISEASFCCSIEISTFSSLFLIIISFRISLERVRYLVLENGEQAAELEYKQRIS